MVMTFAPSPPSSASSTPPDTDSLAPVPSSPTHLSSTRLRPSSPPFDPLAAFLDEQWLHLGLTITPSISPTSTPPHQLFPQSPTHTHPQLLTLAAAATNLSAAAAAWDADFAEAERQLRSALADADAADSLTARSHNDLRAASASLSAAQARVAHFAHRNHDADIELAALHECIATLHAAHDLDASINALLIADQAEEIKELKDNLRILDRQRAGVSSPLCNAPAAVGRSSGLTARQKAAMNLSEEGSDSEVESEDDTVSRRSETPPRGIDVTVSTIRRCKREDLEPDLEGSTASDESGVSEREQDDILRKSESDSRVRYATKRMSARNPRRRKELESLQRTKERMFHSFERRHSTTIESVVRRTSQLSLRTTHTTDSTVVSEMPASTERLA